MSKRVLIVDDDKELCEELSEILKAEGFQAEYCTCPLEGKALLEKCAFDVLVLDFKMPKITGIDLLMDIKKRLNGTKVFFISGSLSIEKSLKDQGLWRFVSGVFVKPLKIEAFLQALQ